MKSTSISTILFILATCVGLYANDYRQFTSNDGQSMRARVLEVNGSLVTIERDDMRRFTVGINVFSEDDQKYIEDWQIQASKVDVKLDIHTRTKRGDVKKFEEHAVEYEEFPSYYEIDISNKTFSDIEGLKLDYTMLHYRQRPGSAGKPEKQVISDSIDLPIILSRREITVETDSFRTINSELKAGWRWASGADDESEDGIAGIWIKIYYGDELVHEYMTPNTIKDDVKFGQDKKTKK